MPKRVLIGLLVLLAILGLVQHASASVLGAGRIDSTLLHTLLRTLLPTSDTSHVSGGSETTSEVD